MKVITTKECYDAYKKKSELRIREDYHICAAKNQSVSSGCHGDSGGLKTFFKWAIQHLFYRKIDYFGFPSDKKQSNGVKH